MNLDLRAVKKLSARARFAVGKAAIALLLVGVACLLGIVFARVAAPRQRVVAADILQRLRGLPTAKYCEDDDERRMAELRRLGSAGRPVIQEFFRQLREARKPDYGLPTCRHEVDYLVNLAIGLDRDGSHSREIATAFLLPALRAQKPLSSPLPRRLVQFP